MPLFEYKALNKKGRKVSGMVTADGPASARLKLSQETIFPMEIREVKTSVKKSIADSFVYRLKRFHRINPAVVSTSMRQLATLVSSSLPLIDCLNALIEQTETPQLKKIFTQIREKVVEGSPLSVAMAEHPAIFSHIYVSMVKAGETSGALDIILKRLADFTEKRLKLSKKIEAAMTYPIFLLMISTVILIFLMSFVMPKVIGIFRGMELVLPWSTRMLIWFTDGMKNYWWLGCLVMIALGAGIYSWIKTEQGGRVWDRIRLRFPLFGRLHHKTVIARFTRTLSILLKSGIPLVEALNTAKPSMDNRIMEDAISDTARLVGEGENFATPLKKSGMFPPMVIQLIRAGEQSGELEEMLAKAADVYDDDVESAIVSLTSIIEPAIILLMGVVVGFIVIAILLPIFDMTSGIR
ncbi:MAG: type II secretion system inner membrane protein GspF [Deltaproteobacteria bacterium]|nr:type II secretion system inner membrane protein GspF [Deltaproteobacteria bacterium]MBW1737376.1 type II secretion system inner membrane protein GspF [Deltaproteobacteria bacterium]MBW1909935.1 type II secretion system inner membrane protein GspF [Deltaproteobacteria bacterium]MBW2033482.1 type II secretion system inner membrane protein GspF [Deltaproteobacteria bacterium]MBW2114615.1 type II secretion system inner membrane protein GspF [Deltaproteobacteria bacterium]